MPIVTFFRRNDRSVWLLYLGLILILSGLYFGSLADLELDTHDLETFRDNVAMSQDFLHLFSSERNLASGRLVAEVVKWLAYCVWGNEAAPFHLLVVALHTLASLLLARLVRLLGHSLPLSLATGLLFLVNTAHFRAVHHISALDYPLAFCCAVGAILCYVHHFSSSRPVWLGGFYGCLFIGILSHLSCLAILPVCVYWAWRQGIVLRRGLLHFLPVVLLLLPVALSSLYLTNKSASTWLALLNYSALRWLEVPYQISGILLWLFGRLYTTAHWLPFTVYKLHLWELYVGFLFLLPHLVLIWRRHVPGAIWTVWMVSALLPFSFLTWNILLTSMAVGPSRYLYMATAGSSALLAWCLRELAGWVARRLGLRDLYAYAVLLVLLLVSSYFSLKRAEALSLYSSGRNYTALGDIQAGIDQMRQALDHAPDTLPLEDLYPRLCLSLISSGDEDFERVAEQGLTLLPNDARLYLYMYAFKSMAADTSIRQQAHYYLEKGEQYAAAQDGISVSLALGKAFNNMAHEFHIAKDFEQAATAYRHSLRYLPNRVDPLVGFAYSLFVLDRMEEAREVIRQVAQIEPQDPRVLYLLALSRQAEETPEALDPALDALMEDKTTYKTYFQLGILYHRNRQFDLAVDAYRQAIRLFPQDFEPHANLGTALMALGRLEEAEQAYGQAILVDPNRTELYHNLGGLKLKQGDKQGALEAFQTAIDKGTTDFQSHLTLGRLYWQEGQRGQALEVYRQMLDLDLQQADSEIYAQIGVYFNETGELDNAVRAYRKALEIDAQNTDARTNLGWLYYTMGQFGAAIAEYLQVLDHRPNSVAQFSLGLAYLHQGDTEAARRAYAQGMQMFGAAEAERVGALQDLQNLVDRGIRVAEAEEILDTYWSE